MPSKFRTFTRKFLVTLNFILALIYVLACLAPYLNPIHWWFISLIGLFFPFLFLLLVLTIFFWLFAKPKYALLFFAVLLLGWNSIAVSFALNAPREFTYNKPPATLRVVSWNVARFVEIRKNNNRGSQTRLKMMDLLKQQNADVLCLQEFHTSAKTDFYDNIVYIQDELHYPYYYFSFNEDGERLYYSSIIFSRLPIIGKGVVTYPRPSLSEVLLHIDVRLGDDTIRIFNTHLQSVQLKKDDYERIDEIKNYDDSILSNSRTVFSKVKRAITHRKLQTSLAKEQISQSPYPVVICADFNDIPNSYTYFNIKGNLQDAFLRKGFGVGRTFSSIAPTLRIDYILASKQLTVLQFNRLVKNYSDHYMIVADIRPSH